VPRNKLDNLGLGMSQSNDGIGYSGQQGANMTTATYGTSHGGIPLPKNYDTGVNVGDGIMPNNNNTASTFGGTPAPNSPGSGFNYNSESRGSLGGSYEGVTSLDTSRATSPRTEDNIMASTMGASQGGIPTPRNYDDGLGVGNNVASNSNTMASNFGDIPAPARENLGTGFGQINSPAHSMSGSYESATGISTLRSNETVTSLDGADNMMASAVGASQGGIPAPSYYDNAQGVGNSITTDSNTMSSPFGGIPVDSMLTTTMGASQGGIPTPSNYDNSQGIGDGITNNSNTMASTSDVIPANTMAASAMGASQGGIPILSNPNYDNMNTMASPFGGIPIDSMMTTTMGASQGGIPTPSNYNDMQGIGDGITTNNSTMASTSDGIPANTMAASAMGASQGGIPAPSYHVNAQGIGNSITTDRNTMVSPFDDITVDSRMTTTMGASQGGIPTPNNNDQFQGIGDGITTNSNTMASPFGDIPATGLGYSNDTTIDQSAGSPGGGSYESISRPIGIETAISLERDTTAASKGVMHMPMSYDNGQGVGGNIANNSNTMASPFGDNIAPNNESEDRIPSPSNSVPYDYQNPFLQS